MTLKGWMLGKGHGTEGRNANLRTPTAFAGGDAAGTREPRFDVFGRGGAAADAQVQLGPYAPLIGAIREELEQFVTNQLRLHLAIAERDRYVLSSIEVECESGEHERDLLRRFTREFRPEQVKHYLAKEIIAGLRNASAIDLSQFAGLNAEREETGASREEERYGDLIAELASGAPRTVARPYRVTLVGRWSEVAPAAAGARTALDGPRTPLAARPIAVDIEDAAGARHVELAVVAGHRYAIGKGEGCDVVVDGAFASRRHCEVWFDKGAWWVADAGSTNGIRVESADGATTHEASDPRGAARQPPMPLAPGARIVLAAHMRGEPREYPRLSLRSLDPPKETKASTAHKAPKVMSLVTPVTPIAPPRKRTRAWTIAARMESGERTFELGPDILPFRVGRSRNQALVVDGAHSEVSGRHLEIVALDAEGADVVVHGDNGVALNGVSYGPGANLRWKAGETLRLGGTSSVACDLTLSSHA